MNDNEQLIADKFDHPEKYYVWMASEIEYINAKFGAAIQVKDAEIARLNSFIEKAFQAHSNLDLDIEALSQGEQNE